MAHPSEELDRVQAAVRFVAGADIVLKDEAIETHHGGTLHVVEAVLDKSRAIRDAVQRILDVEGVPATLAASAEARVDEDGVAYLRVDKQEAYLGRLKLTASEDCVQLRLRFETYPASREAAVAAFAALATSGRA